ncbi:hypothetical protein DI09_53p60 [Mitosporidium daphniae]|uniref:Sec1-like protein n=2 Tax=Mitosporidium daphniae TaxID=1485682 RepID=A0A098VPW5_9MICR|nr:uncharacterized protein DI09_53p60 [Mitosporidium daphniae]KGG50834.1 hypothetical protein DI09_53p60 [Mitosporidium daphniae]|eukprot:XP_013237277.1 uncharacterized protein DI09_53p60 [Mitosporidium daphniae]
MAAIYLLSNLSSSIEKLCSDISDGQYGTYYIYILSKLEDKEVQKLAAAVKTNGSSIKVFMENLCSIKFMGTNGFYLQDFDKEILGKIYAQLYPDKLLEHVGEQLAAVVKEFFPRAEIVARSCFASLNKEKLAPESPTSSSCSLKYILIVDRSFDLISPLLHEFTYEAMLREIESSCDSEYCSEIKKELHLLDNTNLKEEQLGFWSLLRDVHLADCVSTLLKYSESFVASNSAAGFSKETTKDPSKLVSISQMKATIASIPELQEFKKYLLQYCIDTFNRKNLDAVATAEQNLACEYFTSESKPAEDPLNAISSLLADKDISAENKARLLILYLAIVPEMSQLSKSELMTLCKYSDISDVCSINGFYSAFNVRTSQGPERLSMVLPNIKKKHKIKLGSLFKGTFFSKGGGSTEKFDTENKATYELSRFVHPIEALCKARDVLVESALMEETSQSLVTTPGAANMASGKNVYATSNSVRHRQEWKNAAIAVDSSIEAGQAAFEPKALIFIVGGMTSSEVRVSFERSKGHILLGSDFFITPTDFLASLAESGKLCKG